MASREIKVQDEQEQVVAFWHADIHVAGCNYKD